MTQIDLQAALSERASTLAVPGVAVGLYFQGEEHYAFHGVTSVDNPLDVDADTLFQFGSTGKTYTATAMVRLVDQGKVDLHERVRAYLPEFAVADEATSNAVTVLQLFNHTAGWPGDVFDDTGQGDDALERYVARMATLEQDTPLGMAVSYNNASLSVAGRIIEKVTGTTYEQAIKDLLLTPLGLDGTHIFVNDIMTRRFAVGHNQDDDGTITIARPWAMARSGTPAGGISSTAADQIAWARFHLGDGRAKDGTRVLPAELLTSMQQPTVRAGGALGDHIGISWMLRDVDGVRFVQHGGDTIGQHSVFVMVPERDFAITVLTNCGPNGGQLNEELTRWALEAYLGVVIRDPEPIEVDAQTLAQYAGHYETNAATCDVSVAAGGLTLVVEFKPEALAELGIPDTDAEKRQEIEVGMTAGEGDQYVVTDGPAKGMKGYFGRHPDGTISGVHVGGRFALRKASMERA